MAGVKKPRLSLPQLIFFSVGNVMNDMINTITNSYLLIFQTKVLDLPNNVVGLLWLLPAALDAVLALLSGYVSDNFSIPLLSKFYGKRKSWHLLGCALIGICSPFLLMPCFLCGEETSNLKMVFYFTTLMTLSYAGWGLSQSNFLALIPVVAKRQSEMVKLGAISSAITLICGIFVYIVTWALLGSDSNETLSFSQWPKFMYLAVIVVGTGAFFSAMFHLGTREPKTDVNKPKPTSHNNDPGNVNESSEKQHSELVHAHNVSDVIQGWSDTAIINPSFEEDEKTVRKEKELVSLDVNELEAVLWEALSDNSNDKTCDTCSIASSGYGDYSNEETTSGESSDCEVIELPMPETFIDMVPNVSELLLHSHRGSTRSTPCPTPRLSRTASSRNKTGTYVPDVHSSENLYNAVLRSRLNSTSSRISPLPTPRLCRSNRKPFETASINHHKSPHHFDITRTTNTPRNPPQHSIVNTDTIKQQHYEDEKHNEIRIITRNHKQHITSTVSTNIVQDDELITNKLHNTNEKAKSAWKTLFRNPHFYKLATAYMFTRVTQNITTAYLPLFLTDHLQFGKESIAYFPLVTLFSGVFASFAAKRFNKVLGNKWTFCLGSIMVMGASGWFYLLTPENRLAMYVPAILTGCGSSIMFVTSLALAADLVNTDRSSGAFMIASMSILCKISIGVLFYLLQELKPKATGSVCPKCTSYVHHVFAIIPGASSLFGLISFILFIPATIQCRPIAHTAEAETQTDLLSPDEGYNHSNGPLEIIVENETESTMVDVETQTDSLEESSGQTYAVKTDLLQPISTIDKICSTIVRESDDDQCVYNTHL